MPNNCITLHLPVTKHNGIWKKDVSVRFFLLENSIMCPNNVQCPSVEQQRAKNSHQTESSTFFDSFLN